LRVGRDVYVQAQSAETAEIIGGIGYLDSGNAREEIHKTSASSDNYQDWRRRVSADNGATWRDFELLDGVNVQLPAGGIATYPGSPQVDVVSGIRYRSIMKRFWPDNEIYTFDWATHEHPFHDHVFVLEETPQDDSKSRYIEMKYENEERSYDPEQPFQSGFVKVNRAYRGQSFCFDGEGGAFHPMTCRPAQHEYGHTKGGVILMRRTPDGSWLSSNQRYVSEDISSRGMLEPDASILKDGRILIVCRGSDTPKCPGRKWMTWSEDGGEHLAPIEEFRYADGKRFYSPSSIHRFFRSTKNGSLYWIGNICNEPPSGNNPRYPLLIGVIDETKMGLIEESIEVIDDCGPDEPQSLSLSNFYLLENRDTLDIELYMTRMASRDQSFLASAYRYVISIDA
jgi:hypothetical protein